MVTLFHRADQIEVIGLSRSTVRKLRRGKVTTIGKLLDGYSKGILSQISGIGAGALDEIGQQLSHLEISDAVERDLSSPDIVRKMSRDLVLMQREIRQRIEYGLLDNRALVGAYSLKQLLSIPDYTQLPVFWEALGKLMPFQSISDELKVIINLLSPEELFVLVARFNLPQIPLRELAHKLSKSIESVSRIEKDLPAKVKAIYRSSVPGVYIQSALFKAADQGNNLEYLSWLRDLQDRKLLSQGMLPALGHGVSMDESMLLLAVCEILEPSFARYQTPVNLRQAVNKFKRGMEISVRF